MDQAFFGYAIPGILEEFELPLEAVGIVLTISFVIASLLLLYAGTAADRFGRGPMLSLYLAVSAFLVGMQGLAGGIVMLTIFSLAWGSVSAPGFRRLRMPMLQRTSCRVFAAWPWACCNAVIRWVGSWHPCLPCRY